MDAVSLAIYSLNNPFLTQISSLVNNDYFFDAMLLGIFLAISNFSKDSKASRRVGFAIACMALAFLVGFALKDITQVSRPCALSGSKVPCPLGQYSLPSLHASVTFALCLSFFSTELFFPLLAYALFVSFTRIYLGVHTDVDIAAGFGVACISYSILKSHLIQNVVAWMKK